MNAATGAPTVDIRDRPAGAVEDTGGARAPLRRSTTVALRALGALGLAGILTTAFLLAAGAATRPTPIVPGRAGGWPGWLAGPLEGLDVGISADRFQPLVLLMCASYAIVLLAAR